MPAAVLVISASVGKVREAALYVEVKQEEIDTCLALRDRAVLTLPS